jgi:hypothetical protein
MRYTVAPLIAFLSSALPIWAQSVYKVDFEVRGGSDSAAGSNKHYTMLVDESHKGYLHAGSRVSTAAGSPIDVGATIDCTLKALGGKLTLAGNIEISSIAGTLHEEPIIQQAKLSFDAVLETGVSSVIVDARGLGPVVATVTKMQ